MDERPKLWSVSMGISTALVPLVFFLYITRSSALEEVLEVFVGFLVMAILAACVWWILIERSKKLHYHRGAVYLTSVIILWTVALGAVDLIRENGVQVWRADIVDQFGVIAFLLYFGLIILTPFILAGSVALVFMRRYFDDDHRVVPGR